MEQTGYIQNIDLEYLLIVAGEQNLVVRLMRKRGAIVGRGWWPWYGPPIRATRSWTVECTRLSSLEPGAVAYRAARQQARSYPPVRRGAPTHNAPSAPAQSCRQHPESTAKRAKHCCAHAPALCPPRRATRPER